MTCYMEHVTHILFSNSLGVNEVYSLFLIFTASYTPASRNWTPTPRNSPESNTSLSYLSLPGETSVEVLKSSGSYR